jgi:hypothetical protein
VDLGGLSVGLLGEIRLSHLRIGSPRDASDPWLDAAEVRLDFGLCQLLGGHCRPARLEVDGVELRVLRRADGTVELADLVRPVPAPRTGPIDPMHRSERRITVQVHRASVTVIDEPTRTRLQLRDIDGEGYAEGPLAIVEQLGGTLNGGRFRFAGRLDRTQSALAAEARLRADDVALDDGMSLLRYVVPVIAGGSATVVKGRLNADLYLEGRGPTWPILGRGLAGHGAVTLDPLALDGAPLIGEIARFADPGGHRRIGSVRTDFVYRDRRITTDHFTLNIGRIPVTMSGWTDLDGRVDYQMKIEGLRERLPDQARRILGELKRDAGSLTSLALRGKLDRMTVQVAGVPIDTRRLGDAPLRLKPSDREQLRILGRQLRDQLLR